MRCHIFGRVSILSAFLPFLLVFFAVPAFSGDLCGHVRDRETGAPVAQAGVFLRDEAGAYLGQLAVTDADGDFCIADLPGGTYTLEIRVNDYLVAYLPGVLVSDDPSTVPINAILPPFTLEQPWPNPSSSSIFFRLRILRPAPLSVQVFDARGRLMRAWNMVRPDPGPRDYQWDGRDARGRCVPSGLYFMRARASGHIVTRRLVLAR